MRTPLAEVRGLGSAKKGTADFIAQRLTSVVLVVLLVPLVVLVAALSGESHDRVVAALSRPSIALLLLAAIPLTVAHMRLGMQVIIEDYIHAEMPKLALLIANWLLAWGIGLVAVFAILKIAFGT
jgi:succinate dehydrogenase / fumarate reductase membrane anchor subunit